MEATVAAGAVAQGETRRFHVVMAGVFVLIAFGGFVPTYFAKLATGSFHAPPIVHIHGILLFSWTLFYLFQTALVASGRTSSHRSWGLAGIGLFSVLCCSIVATQVTMMRIEEAHGLGDASRRFSTVVFLALPLMITFFIAAISNIRRPEVHKRLMFLLMACMMTPAIARVFLTFLAPPGAADAGPPPPFVAVVPSFVAMLLIVIAFVNDWRTRGRPHKVYVVGGLLFLIETLAIVPVSNSAAWMRIAGSLQHMLG